MKKLFKILLSVGVISGVVWATSAFFSDEERSVGNTFQAGAVNLKIDSECHYYHLKSLTFLSRDGLVIPQPVYESIGCDGFGTWTSTDLTQEKFYSFSDVKPGDLGENTISFKVEDNDAWACMAIENMTNSENDRIEPETSAGDVTDDPQGGELAQNLHFTAWLDQGLTPGWQGKVDMSVNPPTGDKGEGDNIWQNKYEPLIFSNIEGPASDVLGGQVYSLADSTTGNGPIKGDLTHYLGVAWCAGDLIFNQPGMGGTLYCNGEPMDNTSQTDSLSADVRFYAVQARNNPNFVCSPSVFPTPLPTPLPTPTPTPDTDPTTAP